jgi:hypothetical protein
MIATAMAASPVRREVSLETIGTRRRGLSRARYYFTVSPG